MMNIQTNNYDFYFKKIDKNSYNKYNNNRIAKCDTFTLSFKGKLMTQKADVNEIIEKLKGAKNLHLSPVSFLSDCITGLLTNNLSEKDFAKQVITKTQESQLILFQMPKEVISMNSQAFKKEFTLANEINTHIMQADNQAQQNKSLSDIVISSVLKYFS